MAEEITNLDRAEEIAIKICGIAAQYDIENPRHNDYLAAEEAAVDMAEAKDEEFKKYLEKKKEELIKNNWPLSLFGEEKGKCDLIDEILKERFSYLRYKE